MENQYTKNESSIHQPHWWCNKCGAKSNLIRHKDPKKPTYCKECLNQLMSSMDYCLRENGVKWLLDALIDAVEKTPSSNTRKFVGRYVVEVVEDKIKDWDGIC